MDLAVVFLVVGTLLFFVSGSFKGCIKNLTLASDVRRAQALAEEALLKEVVELPSQWQVNKVEHYIGRKILLEVQVLEKESSKIIFNLWWMP